MNLSKKIYCYTAYQLDYKKERIGSLSLAVGQVKLVSDFTGESAHFLFAVFHLGGWDFHCCIQRFSSRLLYTQIKEQLFDSFKKASVVETILEMSKLFGNKSFDLQHLFAEERHDIINKLTVKTKQRLDQLYSQVYRENYSILLAFQLDKLPVPQELQVAAEVAISHRCLTTMAQLENSSYNSMPLDSHLVELEAIAIEANHLRCELNLPMAKETLEKLILHCLFQLLNDSDSNTLEADITIIEKMIKIGKDLHLNLSLNKPQELFFDNLHNNIIPEFFKSKSDHQFNQNGWENQLRSLLKLGEILSVNLSSFLSYTN